MEGWKDPEAAPCIDIAGGPLLGSPQIRQKWQEPQLVQQLLLPHHSVVPGRPQVLVPPGVVPALQAPLLAWPPVMLARCQGWMVAHSTVVFALTWMPTHHADHVENRTCLLPMYQPGTTAIAMSAIVMTAIAKTAIAKKAIAITVELQMAASMALDPAEMSPA
mmetsp:Transcript_23056/g.47918  ORF Transcript_23056/g.47918 Transcript_23056/m.47918 type:complete len:163 (+) Transcript_23056:635-1123(+)